jgi:hypothetical protein
MTGNKATAEDAAVFELLSQRWRDKERAFDPRLVGDWSLEVGDDGEPRLSAFALPRRCQHGANFQGKPLPPIGRGFSS